MRDIQSDGDCPSPCYHDGARLCWAWLSTSLPMGSGELIPWFAVPVCAAAHKTPGACCGAPSLQDSDKFDWNVLGAFYRCECS